MEIQIFKLLKRLISIPSVYPKEKELFLFLLNFFKSKGFKVTKQKVDSNRYNLIVEKGRGTKSIALYSHLDTVSVSRNWSKNPFKLIIQKDKGYGLGSYDMKGGIAVNIFTFLDSNPKNFKLKLIFCVDEEDISRGAFAIKKSKHIKDVKCVLSPEPAFKNGLQGVVIGRVGRAVYEINISNKPEHFMFYNTKSDLFLFISSITKELEKFYKEDKDGRQFIFIRNIKSFYNGISVPDRLIIELDSSVLPPNDNKIVFKKIEDIVKQKLSQFKNIKANVTFKKRETPFLTSYKLKSNDLYLIEMKKTIKEISGKKAIPYFRSSVADENVFGAMGITVLGVGPLGANAHCPDEYVELSSLVRLLKIYKRFISNIDKLQGLNTIN